jgi:aminopeptidase N
MYGEILADAGLPLSLKAYFLRIDEQPVARIYATWYPELVAAREKIMGAVNRLYREQLLAEFRRLDSLSSGRQATLQEGIERRMLKQVLLELITIDDSEDSHRLILDELRAAATATERVSALSALNRSSAPSRREMLEKTYEEWHAHLSGYANYLRIISSGTRQDVFDMIEAEKKRPTFDITQPTWCRALFLPMATNNKMVWTDRGVEWVADTVIELAGVNVITASRLLNAFQHVGLLKPGLKEKVRPAVEKIARKVSEKTSPTIHGQATSYLTEK